MGVKLNSLPKKLREQVKKNNLKLPRKSTVVQKQQDAYPRKNHNKARVSRDHEPNNGPFRVSVQIYSSDRYERDLDGQLSTIMDCLVDAGVLPDDNRFVVPEESVKGYDCDAGEDRVIVEVERL